MMLANNEVGTIQPVKELCKACSEMGVLTFTDAVQAIVSMEIDVKDLGVSMLSFSAHKFGGPKGVGVLYVKNGTKLSPVISGGHQERSKRGGTSNVAGAVGLAKALSLSRENLEKDRLYVLNLREHFINRVLSEIPNTHLNGDRENRLVNNANILFNGINGEKLLYQLDLKGVCASLGAACSAGTIEPSVVLKEIGLSDIQAKSSIRFTFSTNNTIEEVDRVIEILKEEIKK
jgi:cysteine desulfurase